jgi:membrane protease YdiL (CAAX protease family)
VPLDERSEAPATPPPELAPEDLTWRSLLPAVALIWAMELVLAVLLGVWSLATAGPEAATDLPPVPLAVASVASGAWTLMVCWAFACRGRRLPLREGFALQPLPRHGLRTVVALGVGGALTGIWMSSRFATGDSPIEQLTSTRAGLLAVSAAAVLLPPIEEIYYRGFVYPVLRRHLGVPAAFAFVTLWFGLAHGLQLGGHVAPLLLITSMGALWTLQRELTGSLTMSLCTHWLYNGTLVAAGMLLGPE